MNYKAPRNQLSPQKKHGSWLGIAEIELNVMTRQCLSRQIDDIDNLRGELSAWETSSKAYIRDSVEIGDNVFVFENSVLQYHVMIGDDTILWSGNHIEHRTKIGKHCWITSHDVVLRAGAVLT